VKSITPFLLAVALLPATYAANAEVLLLDAIAEAPVNGPEGIPRPERGATMKDVRQRFGEPLRELPWVGDPPISRWVYQDFTVYFENEYVIDSVVHR